MNKFLIVAGVVGLTAVISLTLPRMSARAEYNSEAARAEVASKNLKKVDALSSAFENVADVIKPSVVSITSVKKVSSAVQGGNFSDDPSFRDFFGNDLFQRFFHVPTPKREYEVRGLGTGVIVSPDGYILTNNHVVKDAEEVTVTLSDDRQFKGKIVGTDPKSDLAVLKIDESGLHPAVLGDSRNVRIGEWVVAVGDPFGLSHTLTAGVISAKGRANVGLADYEDFIQTDAAINPGNSGGPLVDLRGKVVGINTAIFTRSGGYMGIGFAIPSNLAKKVMGSLIKTGKVVRGWLGVLIQGLDKNLASSFGYDSKEGALVGDVTSGSPAEKAGLQQGDIITRFAGKKVTSSLELRSAVADVKPGTTVEVKVFRQGKEKTLKVKIGELKSDAAGGSPTEMGSTPDLGMEVMNLTPAVAQNLGIDRMAGVVVSSIEPFGPAAKAGLKVYDVILKVQGKPVMNTTQFHAEMRKYDLKKGVRLTIQSGQMQRFAFLRAGS